MPSGAPKMQVGVNLETRPAAKKQPTGDRRDFHVVVLADFSGRASRGECDPAGIAARRVVTLDRDNYEELPARFATRVRLAEPPAAAGAELAITQLDDFRPEFLYEQVAAFAALRQLRRRLMNPDTFSAAAQELSGGASGTPAKPPSDLPEPDSETNDADGSGDLASGLLDAAIAATDPGAAPRGPTTGSRVVDEIIREAIAPYVLPKPDPRRDELVAAVDAAASGLMRSVLHDRHFRQLEAAWRGMAMLARRVETDRRRKLFLVDVSQQELALDLQDATDPSQSATGKLLAERLNQRDQPVVPTVIVGLYDFDAEESDAAVLERLAQIASQVGAPLIAGARVGVVGCPSLGVAPDPDQWSLARESAGVRAWDRLRSQPSAGYLGLAFPRFLLRAPYGKQTDAVEGFDFEEWEKLSSHEDYLWGNPALLVALALAEADLQAGEPTFPRGPQRVDGLPLHYHLEEGERAMQPCAEAWLTEQAARAIAAAGLMPVLSVRGEDAVLVGSLRSLTTPESPLAGPWGAS